MASLRPYRDVDFLLGSAEVIVSFLTDEEWRQAFAAHPRIGEQGGHAPSTSEREQSQVMKASNQTLTALAAENRQYEERFGHVFLIAASGRTADEILSELRRRMKNDPATEFQVAKDQQQKIARLRLEKLLFP